MAFILVYLPNLIDTVLEDKVYLPKLVVISLLISDSKWKYYNIGCNYEISKFKISFINNYHTFSLVSGIMTIFLTLWFVIQCEQFERQTRIIFLTKGDKIYIFIISISF